MARATTKPWTFLLAKWYGYVFSLMFILYGGVNVVLGVLDRNYDSIFQSFLFLLVGVLLINICFAYRDRKSWGWYGLVATNVLVVLLALFGLGQVLNIVLMLISLLTLAALFAPQTKAQIFQGS